MCYNKCFEASESAAPKAANLLPTQKPQKHLIHSAFSRNMVEGTFDLIKLRVALLRTCFERFEAFIAQ